MANDWLLLETLGDEPVVVVPPVAPGAGHPARHSHQTVAQRSATRTADSGSAGLGPDHRYPAVTVHSGRIPPCSPHTAARSPTTWPRKELVPDETKVLSQAIQAKPGDRMCSAWDVTDRRGDPISVGWVAGADLETMPDGTQHLITRAMNWRGHARGLLRCPTAWGSAPSTGWRSRVFIVRSSISTAGRC
jgi:hypothetical protein